MKKYQIIYADPAWKYNDKRVSITSDRPERYGGISYDVMDIEELSKLPIKDIADDNCTLFMWVTMPLLQDCFKVIDTWGFEYRTVAFVWDKMRHNPGIYTLSNCELCLVFKRGKIPTPRGARNIQQLVRSPRKEHSEKPIEVIQAIEKMFPNHERIELFARREVKGLSAWGLDMIKKGNELSSG